MTLNFGDLSVVTREFRNVVLFFGSLVIIITIAFQLGYRRSPLPMSLTTRLALALVGVVAVVWYAYDSSYRHFVSLQASRTEFRLTFVGPFSREVVIPNREILTVTYGLPDRGASRCRLSVDAAAGTYHSTWIQDENSICRKHRDALLQLLGR